MRTYNMYDACNTYENKEDVMGEKIWLGNADTESNGRRFQETLPDIAATMRSLIKAQEEQYWLNASMLQSLTDIQWRMSSGRHIAKLEGSKSSTRRRRRSSSRSPNSKGSTRDSSSSSHREREGDVIGTTHEMSLRRQRCLPSMVRQKMVKKLRLGFSGSGSISKSRTVLEIWRI